MCLNLGIELSALLQTLAHVVCSQSLSVPSHIVCSLTSPPQGFRLPSAALTELQLSLSKSLCSPYQFTTFFESSTQKNGKNVVKKSNSNYFPVLKSEYLVAIITNNFISWSIRLSLLNMKSFQEYKFGQTHL